MDKTHSVSTYHDYYKEQLEKDGVALIEDSNRYPLESNSYITTCLMIVLHKQGELHVRYDLKDKTLTEHKVVLLLPKHMISDYWASDDFKRTLILIAPRIYDQLKHTTSYRNHLLYHEEPECELTEEQWNSILPGVKVLRTIINSTSLNRDQMLVNYLDILFDLLNNYNVTNRGELLSDNSNRQLFTRFYELLIANYHKSRDIIFYASKLYLTPKYFAKLIKQATGISASEWIDNYVIMQAKTLLAGYSQLTIQQIANQLGFTEQSTFCRYFKTRVGQSPSDFRNSQT